MRSSFNLRRGLRISVSTPTVSQTTSMQGAYNRSTHVCADSYSSQADSVGDALISDPLAVLPMNLPCSLRENTTLLPHLRLRQSLSPVRLHAELTRLPILVSSTRSAFCPVHHERPRSSRARSLTVSNAYRAIDSSSGRILPRRVQSYSFFHSRRCILLATPTRSGQCASQRGRSGANDPHSPSSNTLRASPRSRENLIAADGAHEGFESSCAADAASCPERQTNFCDARCTTHALHRHHATRRGTAMWMWTPTHIWPAAMLRVSRGRRAVYTILS